jgi:hypothetical protein
VSSSSSEFSPRFTSYRPSLFLWSISPPAISFKRLSPAENTVDAGTDKAVDCISGRGDWNLRKVAIYQQKTEPRRWEARLFLGQMVAPDHALREKRSA